MIGAAAVAAVGAATIPFAQPDAPRVVTTVTTLAPNSGPASGEDPAATGQSEEVADFAEGVHSWSDCIKAAVDEHVADRGESKGGFDPQGTCGEPPKYVGRDGELPVQASDKAGENRLKNAEQEPGEPNGNANGKDATGAEDNRGGNGNGGDRGNGRSEDKTP
jgi:hypothetical protein